ncbi:hypothetical protein Tco_1271994 [Tanacetum coccineum]
MVLIAKGRLKKVMTKPMMKPTMEEYVTEVQGDYYSGITKTMINGKAAYELKGKFLDDLRNNAFSGINEEDAVEHIESFLKIIDPLELPHISYERLGLVVFPISLTGDASEWLVVFPISLTRDASEWLMNKPQSSITTWVDLTDKFFGKYYPPSHTGKIGDDQEVLTDEAFSDLKETYEDGEYEIEGMMKKLFKKKGSRMMIMSSTTLTMTWFEIMHLDMLTKRRSNTEKIGANCLEIPTKNVWFVKLEGLRSQYGVSWFWDTTYQLPE